jgi:hypothetical protein
VDKSHPNELNILPYTGIVLRRRNMAFQRFKVVVPNPRVKPTITIRSQGFIRINAPAMQEFGFDKANYIALFFDPETKKVAIAIADQGEEGAIKLTKTKNGGVFSAAPFLKFFNLEAMMGHRYEVERDGDYLVVGAVSEVLPTPTEKQRIPTEDSDDEADVNLEEVHAAA